MISNFVSFITGLIDRFMAKYYPPEQAPKTPDFTESSPIKPIESVTNSAVTPISGLQKVYDAAKVSLGTQLTLDKAVDPTKRCAQAVSAILKQAGYPIPPKGIYTVANLIAWMLKNGFKEVTTPQYGCVITARRPDGQFTHTGIVLKYGIASNDSRPQYLGRFMENYQDVAHWKAYYDIHNSTTRYFLPV